MERNKRHTTPKLGAAALIRDVIGKFRRDDDGAVFVMALVILMMMLIVTGMGVDVVRMEAARVQIQQTADRAALAAADLDQTLDAKEVVEDYFEKAGLSGQLTKVTVDEGLNYKRVKAEADVEVPTFFLHMVGMESLNTAGVGEAEERVSDIEISLVVDISGSMGSNNRMTNLKKAAKDFFDVVADDQRPETGVTSISIVPYNATVIAGENLLSYFNTTDWHEESHCIRFRDDDFDDHAISRTELLERVGHFAEGWGNYKTPSDYIRWCRNEDHHEILPFETRVWKLKNHIDGLRASGWTAIDVGMKWGSALLDTNMRPVVNDMIQKNQKEAIVQNWPLDYDADDAIKVIVLMTDGANTIQKDLEDRWKFDPNNPSEPAMSDVYYSPSKGSSRRRDGYYVKFPNNYSWARWYRPRKENKTGDDRWYSATSSNVPNDLEQLSYQDLLEYYRNRDAGEYFFRHHSWSFRNDFKYGITEHDTYSQIDERTQDICDAIKEKQVIIFSIAFEAPWSGQQIMKYCATTPGHYYDVDGTDISYAFRSIASQINHLRLIQ